MSTTTIGGIDYLVGIDDTGLVQGLRQLPQVISRSGQPAATAAGQLGTQMGRSISTATAAALQQQLQQALKQRIQAASNGLPDITIGSDTSAVDAGLAGVKARLQALQGKTVGVDIDAGDAEKEISTLLADLRQVAAQSPDVQVRASATEAIRQLSDVRAAVRELPDGTVRVDADTGAAERALRRLGETPAAGEAGREISGGLGDELSDGMAKLTSKAGPLLGSILGIVNIVAGIGVGALLWKAIENGFEQESRAGLFKAQTGLNPVDVARYGRAAGESYAQNFGESVEGNLDAARIALQDGLLGGASTQQEITNTTNQLLSVAQILGEDVPAVARAAGQAIKTGLSANATEAFDLITKAQQNGLNVSEDLLDTINEYGTQWRKIGLDGPTALGLVSQAVKNGARDVDLAADAIKEFSIRSIDGSATTVDAYNRLGLSAKTMQETISAGGPKAAEALQTIFDRLRDVKDPADKAAISVELFGTQAEDLGAAINSFDLGKARAEFGSTAGVIDQAMADIGNNPAGQIETAKRSIETAANGISAAVAAAFGPAIGQAADWVTSNRAEVTQFIMTTGHYFLEFVGMLAAQTANGLDTLAAFAPALKTLGLQFLAFAVLAQQVWGDLPFTDGDEADRNIANLLALGTSFRQSMNDVQVAATEGAAGIRSTVIPAVEEAQDRFDAVAIPAVAQAAFADATTRLGKGLDAVTASAVETQGGVDKMSGSIVMSSGAGQTLDAQLRTVAASMLDQASKGAILGQAQDELTGRYNAGRDALINQLMQMGLTREAADKLTASYGLVPGAVDTIVSDKGTAASVRGQVQSLNAEIGNIKDRTVTIKALLQGVTPAITGGRPAAQGAGGSGGQTAYATGGPVFGAGTATSDSIDAKLSNGEHVWTASEVEAAGGHAAVSQMRKAVRGYATGGAVGDDIGVKMPSADAMHGAQNSMLRSFASVAQQMESAAKAAASAADESGGPAQGGAPSGGSGWKWQVATIKKAFPNIAITSTTRPGAKTVSGNTSYHARGRAIDMSPSMQAFNWIKSNFPGTAELIFSPAGAAQIKNGRSHIYSGAVKAMHYNHVHWAYDQGGVASGRGYLPKATPLPERVLSPQQTQSFERLVDGLLSNGGTTTTGGTHVEIHQHNTLSDLGIVAVTARQTAHEVSAALMTTRTR